MSNITIDSSSFSNQLGIYDFFNVFISGFIFIAAISAMNIKVYTLLWTNMTASQMFFIIILSYITGLLLQELGSFADSKIFNFYQYGIRNFLKSKFDENGNRILINDIIDNPELTKKYRCRADKVISKSLRSNKYRYEKDNVNRYVFSIFQYYVSVNSKDTKVEKMRALFSMSKTLMSCFAVLAFLALFALPFDIEMTIQIWNTIGLPNHSCPNCMDKVLLFLCFTILSIIFYYRTKKVMRRFLLILLGTYDALIELEEHTSKQTTYNGRSKLK